MRLGRKDASIVAAATVGETIRMCIPSDTPSRTTRTNTGHLLPFAPDLAT